MFHSWTQHSVSGESRVVDIWHKGCHIWCVDDNEGFGFSEINVARNAIKFFFLISGTMIV